VKPKPQPSQKKRHGNSNGGRAGRLASHLTRRQARWADLG